MKKMNKKGFTLIELLIVIAIIGMLAVAFAPSLFGAPSKARDTQRIADLTDLNKYFLNLSLRGNLPVSGCIDGGIKDPLVIAGAEAQFGGTLPIDPSYGDSDRLFSVKNGIDGGCKSYMYIKNPTSDYSFGLYAKMEDGESGNALCDDLVNESDKLNTGTDCYAILTQ